MLRNFAILLIAAWAGAAHAEWTADTLLKALSERPAGQSRYSETKTSALLKEPLKSSGTLRYKKPAFLEKRVLTPFEEILTVDGERMTWEKPAANKKHTMALRDYPVVWGFIESMRATLNGDAKTLQRFYKVRLDGDEGQWTLVLLPSDIDMAQFIRVIRISGSRTRLATVEIEEAGGDRSLMTLREEGN
jgi:outer membrane lipoprotein-sorting protein